jgi:hypothetical protein
MREALARYRGDRDWYRYRSTLFQMAELLRASDRAEEAVRAYLEVCYLDLNEALSEGSEVDPDALEFGPEGFLAFGALAEIRNIRTELQLGSDRIKEMFLDAAAELQGDAKFPVAPKSALERLCLELPL